MEQFDNEDEGTYEDDDNAAENDDEVHAKLPISLAASIILGVLSIVFALFLALICMQ